jgi:hypothetical protein
MTSSCPPGPSGNVRGTTRALAASLVAHDVREHRPVPDPATAIAFKLHLVLRHRERRSDSR